MKTKRITPVDYVAPSQYPLDLEVFSVTEFKHRLNGNILDTERSLFYLILAVTKGEFSHSVDFVTHICHRTQWLLIKPNQVHRFDANLHWDGWLICIKPTLFTTICLPAAASSDEQFIEQLPNALPLSEQTVLQSTQLIVQMMDDALRDAPIDERNAILFHQINALVLRWFWEVSPSGKQQRDKTVSGDLYRRFKQQLERYFTQQHQVNFYANLLGCSDKTLTRACINMGGISAKVAIMQRLFLEAKRLLVYTESSIQTISEQLEFDEPTHFIKFFKQYGHQTPLQFRVTQKLGH